MKFELHDLRLIFDTKIICANREADSSGLDIEVVGLKLLNC